MVRPASADQQQPPQDVPLLHNGWTGGKDEAAAVWENMGAAVSVAMNKAAASHRRIDLVLCMGFLLVIFVCY